MTPLVSVVVPVLNGATTIERTLEALLRQTYPNLEIVVSDNGSTDELKEIGSRIDAGYYDYRLRYHRLEHTVSQNESWRYAYRLARGDLVILHAADDFTLAPDFVEKMAAPLIADQSLGFSVCGTNVVASEGFDGRAADQMHKVHEKIDAHCRDLLAMDDAKTRAGKIVFDSMENRVGTPYNALVRRGCLPWEHWKKTSHYWPESYADWDFMVRLYLNHKGAWVADTRLDYHLTEGGGYWKIVVARDKRITLFDRMYRLMMPVTLLCDPELSELRKAAGREALDHIYVLVKHRLQEAEQASDWLAEDK